MLSSFQEVVSSQPDLNHYFLTKTGHNPYDNDFWVPKLTDFIRSAYKAGKPIAAICYGHQIVGRALGGVAALNPKGWELGVGSIQLSAEGARLFGKDRIVSLFCSYPALCILKFIRISIKCIEMLLLNYHQT